MEELKKNFIINTVRALHHEGKILAEIMAGGSGRYDLREWSEEKHAEIFAEYLKEMKHLDFLRDVRELMASGDFGALAKMVEDRKELEEFKLLVALTKTYKKLCEMVGKGTGKAPGVKCDCGSIYRDTPQGKLQHEKTKKHIDSVRIVEPEEFKLFDGFMGRMEYMKALQAKHPTAKGIRKKVLAIKTVEEREALERELAAAVLS